MSALTAYIDSDAEARSFLEGNPDPWGMTVNPAYRGISLPTTAWPLLDTFVPQFTEPANACLFYNPVPYMPLVAAPLPRLVQIAQSLQFAIANSTTRCHQPVEGVIEQARLKPIGREFPGFRFMVGITSLGDAARYGLDTAELQTRSSLRPDQPFTDAEGRTFVAPDDDSMRAAVAALKPDETTRSWPLSYSALRDDPSTAGAYPGAMLVYAQVPTSGLPVHEAKAFATFLRFAVTDGQKPGYGNGQLPPGYLPLTAANGLGALVAYTQRAADAVESQDGSVPDLVSTGVPTEAPGSSADTEPPSAPSDTPAAVGSEAGGPYAGPAARNGARTTGNRTKGPAAAARGGHQEAGSGRRDAVVPVRCPRTVAALGDHHRPGRRRHRRWPVRGGSRPTGEVSTVIEAPVGDARPAPADAPQPRADERVRQPVRRSAVAAPRPPSRGSPADPVPADGHRLGAGVDQRARAVVTGLRLRPERMERDRRTTTPVRPGP